MSRMLDDIRAEPGELLRCLASVTGPQRQALGEAAGLLRAARNVFVVGIGSSWNAALAVAGLLCRGGIEAAAADASEFLHREAIPLGAALVMLSRSGRSIEIVRLLERAEGCGARVVAVTNTPGSALAEAADVAVFPRARFDHLVSVTMYSAIALAGGLLAEEASGRLDTRLEEALAGALECAGASLPGWEAALEESRWLAAEAPCWYFLARGTSLASCHEARLLWEEAAKTPATALTTGGFRHGSQEAMQPGMRIGLWAGERARNADLLLARELGAAGASVMLVGCGTGGGADLALQVPASPAGWQFLYDVIPAQLAAERLSRLRGADCDSFRLCPCVIESETGLGAL